MQELGTWGGLRCHPTAINDKGVIVGISTNPSNRFEGFIIQPKYPGRMETPQWTRKPSPPNSNALMQRIGSVSNGPLMNPLWLNEQGQVVGRTNAAGAIAFCLTPLAKASSNENRNAKRNAMEMIWYKDQDQNGRNDLVKLLPLKERQAKHQSPRLSGVIFPGDLSSITCWIRDDINDVPACTKWNLDSKGEITPTPTNLKLPSGEIGQELVNELGLLSGKRMLNIHGAKIKLPRDSVNEGLVTFVLKLESNQ